MANEQEPTLEPTRVEPDSEALARRAFLKKVSVASATVPAISLLLAARFKPASAQVAPYGPGGTGSGSGGSGTGSGSGSS